MTAAALLGDLRTRGVAFSIDGGKLIIDAPRGVLAEADVARLRAHKPELLALLQTAPASHAEAVEWLADPQQQPEAHDTADAFHDSPTALWEAAEEPGDGCPRCGSLAAWWSPLDTRRCLNCEPPRPDADAIRAKAARIRQRTMKTQH